MSLLTQYGVKVEINTVPSGTAVYKELDQGFDNLDEALNDVVNEYFFLGDDGFGTSYVTGQHPSYKLTGVRVLGDDAQDFIFGLKHDLMADRETDIKITIGTELVSCPVTITDIKSFGGATTDGAAVECTLVFKGAPTVSTVSP